MASYRSGREAKYADTVGLDSDEEDNENDSSLGFAASNAKEKRSGISLINREEGLSISATTFIAGSRHTAIPGGPFSAVTPSVWPQDILAKIQQLEECRDQLDYRYDEFGFKVSTRLIILLNYRANCG